MAAVPMSKAKQFWKIRCFNDRCRWVHYGFCFRPDIAIAADGCKNYEEMS